MRRSIIAGGYLLDFGKSCGHTSVPPSPGILGAGFHVFHFNLTEGKAGDVKFIVVPKTVLYMYLPVAPAWHGGVEI